MVRNSNSEEQNLVEQFNRDGYVFLPQFLGKEEIETLQENVKRYIAEIVPSMPVEHVFYEDKTTMTSLKQIQHMFKYDQYFHDLMIGSRFEKLAAQLLDHEVLPINMQYFNKPPGIGKPTPVHQDGYYFMLEPNEAVTMWLALDDVDEKNGCVRYVRGSHLRGLRPHGRTQTLGFSQSILDFGLDEDIQNEVSFPAQPGDLLVHHALTIHRADGNNSTNRTRQALGFIYYSTEAKADEERVRKTQADLMKELKNSGKI